MNFTDGILYYSYVANTGLGIQFRSKSFLVETQDELIIISPANFDQEMIKNIKESPLKKVFIAPNNFHNINLAKMKSLFPDASFYGPKRSEEQSGVVLIRNKELDISDEIIPIKIYGNYKLMETCFYHSPSKSLIITDLLFNMHHKMNFPTRAILTIAGAYHKLNMSRLLKFTINDKDLFIKSLKSLLDYPFEHVLLNHGDRITRKEFEIFVNGLKL